MPSLIEDKTEFENLVNKNQLTVVHFAADWAEQCGQIDDLLDIMSKDNEFANVSFARCMAEDLSDVSLKYKIEAVPAVVLFNSGKALDRVDGVDTLKITEKVKQYSKDSGEKVKALDERLKELINKSKIMLFMKGDRKTPRCGFSKQIIQILNDTGMDYETFDILSDEDVRQGLKTFSDWPTYPQLYVNGELIGGLDIVKELVAAGELVQALSC